MGLINRMITHLGCIMDGNRRWAAERGVHSLMGHKEGVKAVGRAIECCLQYDIKHLSLYTFSIENFNRSDEEKSYLFNLFAEVMKSEFMETVHKHQIKIRVIGDRTLFPSSVVPVIQELERVTASYGELTVYLLFVYGGTHEIVATAKRLAADVKDGIVDVDQIDAHLFRQYSWLGDVPDPDLVIRSGGYSRLSNFLLYQVAYSELYVIDTWWPDMSAADFDKAIAYFKSCKRRFGG